MSSQIGDDERIETEVAYLFRQFGEFLELPGMFERIEADPVLSDQLVSATVLVRKIKRSLEWNHQNGRGLTAAGATPSPR